MIYLNVTKGVSGDMLLAALIGLLDDIDQGKVADAMRRAAKERGLEFQLVEVEDSGESGLALSYVRREPPAHGLDLDEGMRLLTSVETEIGSESTLGKQILLSIFNAEAEAHGEKVENVHLHEIGRTEAILNIAGIGLVADLLKKQGQSLFECSKLTIGKGTVVISHGVIRIPAPASKILLRGLAHEEGISQGEMATPTGIAALKVLCPSQNRSPPDRYSKRSIGFGTKRFGGHLGCVEALLV